MTNLVLKHKIWVHAIVATFNKLPLILPENEKFIYKTIADCFTNQKCTILALNGTQDHVHVVFMMNTDQSIEHCFKNVLEESASIINTELFKANSFSWHINVCAFSISESQLQKVIDYVQNQKELHKQKTYQREIGEFIKLHGLED